MKKNILLYGIIIVLACGLTATTTYIIMKDNNKPEIKDNQNNEDKSSEKDEETENKEQVTLSESELNMYLNYIPTDFINGEGETFKSEVTNLNTINKKYLMSRALAQTNDFWDKFCNLPNNLCNEKYYEEDFEFTGGWVMKNATSKINTITKTMYNMTLKDLKVKNITISTIDRENFLNVKNEISDEDTYYARSYMYQYINGNVYGVENYSFECETINIAEDYKIEDDNLIIYSYAVYSMIDDYIEDIYTSKKIEAPLSRSDSFVIDYVKRNKSKFTKFKNTYKKNDLGYYWYQTEVV